MGAGILPISFYKNRIYLLFGKENKYADTPGWSDFGGGIDKGETAYKTVIREAQEELTGFLGGDKEIKKIIGKNPYTISHNGYQMFVCPIAYDELLPFYYNNNQRFLQKSLDPRIIEKSKIFEKDEIRWVPFDHIKKMRPEFRSYFKEVIDIILSKKSDFLKIVKKNKWTRKVRN